MVQERLSVEEFWRWPDHVARYLQVACSVAGQRVLDAGTGVGYGAALLRTRGAEAVVGVDIDAAAIAAARAAYPQSGLVFLEGDCETLSVAPGPFDVICSFENIEHLQNPERFLDAAASRLSPEGTLYISTPDRAVMPAYVNGRPANPYHVQEWFADEFRQLLETRFGQVILKTQVKGARVRAGQVVNAMVAKAIHEVYSNPVVRLGRLWQRLWGRTHFWPDFDQLIQGVVAGPEDYPIVESPLVPFLGQPWCHFAICTQPRGRSA